MNARIGRKRLLVVLPLVVAISVVAIGAAGSASAADTARRGDAGKILIRGGTQSPLRFEVVGGSVGPGDVLTIKNKTNPNVVGPHTFSLVKKGAQPDSRNQHQKCFRPGHICREIAKWHGFPGPPAEDVEVGDPGWDQEGNLNREGDSWFTDQQDQETSRNVSAGDGTTLHFMCAIHSRMQGKIDVVQP